MMVGDTFQKSGLAVALQKDSVWTEKISLEILKMRETGEMEQMDRYYSRYYKYSTHAQWILLIANISPSILTSSCVLFLPVIENV